MAERSFFGIRVKGGATERDRRVIDRFRYFNCRFLPRSRLPDLHEFKKYCGICCFLFSGKQGQLLDFGLLSTWIPGSSHCVREFPVVQSHCKESICCPGNLWREPDLDGTLNLCSINLI